MHSDHSHLIDIRKFLLVCLVDLGRQDIVNKIERFNMSIDIDYLEMRVWEIARNLNNTEMMEKIEYFGSQAYKVHN